MQCIYTSHSVNVKPMLKVKKVNYQFVFTDFSHIFDAENFTTVRLTLLNSDPLGSSWPFHLT